MILTSENGIIPYEMLASHAQYYTCDIMTCIFYFYFQQDYLYARSAFLVFFMNRFSLYNSPFVHFIVF